MDKIDGCKLDSQSLGPFTKIAKLRIQNPKHWEHHRGGWKYVCSLFARELHADDGIHFVSAVEDEIAEERVINEPWVGFLHQVPKHSYRWFPDLERLLQRECWKDSLPNCRGIFVLSSVLKDYLRAQSLKVPIARVLYPVEEPERLFSFDCFAVSKKKRLLFVGEYLRNFQAFYDLKASGWSKQLLANERFRSANLRRNDSVETLDRVADADYDALLEESVVFLALDGAPANTTVVECIVRNTPVMVNRLPGVVEYLGDDYPLYYNSLEEADSKLQDLDLIRAASDYLQCSPIKPKLSADYFLRSIQNTAIYRQLPVPPSQAKGDSRSYDVSIVICSYKRVYNMNALLKSFSEQDFEGTFEVLIWNNSYQSRDEIDNLYNKYKRLLNLNVIHSTENFYCVIRLAIASLIRSELILICDDDVRPARNYISTFLRKYQEYGPRAVLCCRGNLFKPHELNEEEPQRFWTDYEHLRFFDEGKTDRQVHFMHADNCLIPKYVMQEALQHELRRYEYWLIDDYWLSYVFSHVLNIPIWKIKADEALTFTPCADDPQIALYHNPRVAEQRINFYIDHMREGWPFPNKIDAQAEPNRRSECQLQKFGYWASGFRGVNMFSEAPRVDFESARRLGVTVVRLGAVGGAQDFRYLIDDTGTDAVLTESTLKRLERSIQNAAEFDLKVIVTLCHLPGRLFGIGYDQHDLRLWCLEEFREKFVTMWGILSQHLNQFDNVIGYDLINEPYSNDDTQRGFFGEMSERGTEILNSLYSQAILEITKHDPETPIILESGYWASPRTFKFLSPHSDRRIVYSFHMYAPRAFTHRRANRGRFSYPGVAPFWPNSPWSEKRYWEKAALKELLSDVRDWQRRHQIRNENIFVGEFGVSRDVRGASEYLSDLIDIFREFGWSWTVFAFRDEEWDAMNYELGTDVRNMLIPEGNKLFDLLSANFT
jgi:glycosyltransferase involved in cell wall biosynthesis